MRCANCSACDSDRVQMVAERPNRTSLAMASACSKSSAGSTAATGPKTSSCAMVMFGVTPPSTVGATKWPRPSAPSVESHAAGQHLCAGACRRGDFGDDPIGMCGIDARPDVDARFETRPHLHRLGLRDQLLAEGLGDRALHDRA